MSYDLIHPPMGNSLPHPCVYSLSSTVVGDASRGSIRTGLNDCSTCPQAWVRLDTQNALGKQIFKRMGYRSWKDSEAEHAEIGRSNAEMGKGAGATASK